MNRAKWGRDNPDCVHYWVVDEHDVGRCKNCPAVKDFGALQKRESKSAAVMIEVAARRGGKRGVKHGTSKG